MVNRMKLKRPESFFLSPFYPFLFLNHGCLLLEVIEDDFFLFVASITSVVYIPTLHNFAQCLVLHVLVAVPPFSVEIGIVRFPMWLFNIHHWLESVKVESFNSTYSTFPESGLNPQLG